MKPSLASTILTLAVAAGLPAPASAQAPPLTNRLSLAAGVSVTTQSDDETHLGSGPLLSIELSRPFARRFQWEGELSIARLRRDSGYLAATSTPVVGTARVTYFFLSPTSKARPFVSAGVALTRHRGHFIWTHSIPGPGGRPIEGPQERHDWRLTKPGWESGLGVELRGNGRMWWRPEVRLGATQGNRDYAPGVDTLEAPILTIRGGLVVGWR